MKGNERLIAVLTAQREADVARQTSRRWAEYLIRRFRINPEGIDLVCWLARANCRTNRDALVAWVQLQMANEEFSDMSEVDVADVLSLRLHCRLQRIAESVAN